LDGDEGKVQKKKEEKDELSHLVGQLELLKALVCGHL